jgi:DNA-binding MurR/RpiR family transcriptional regulator
MEAAFSTVEQLAHQIQTSTTTIVRLSLYLGYTGYAEFQRELQELLKSNTRPTTKLAISFKEQIGKQNFIQKIITQEMENLSKTLDRISDDLVLQAVNILRKSKQIYVLGLRSCFSIAHFLSYNLMRIFENSLLLGEVGGVLSEQINTITKDDVLIAITMPRYIRDVVKISQIAKERGASIISITDGHLSPLADYSDILFVVECKSTGFHNSVTTAMIIAQLLIGGCTIQNMKQIKQNLLKTEQIHQQMQIHIDSTY